MIIVIYFVREYFLFEEFTMSVGWFFSSTFDVLFLTFQFLSFLVIGREENEKDVSESSVCFVHLIDRSGTKLYQAHFSLSTLT